MCEPPQKKIAPAAGIALSAGGTSVVVRVITSAGDGAAGSDGQLRWSCCASDSWTKQRGSDGMLVACWWHAILTK